MKLSTQPYKGARDFYPEDKQVLDYIFNTWRKVAKLYGYSEYDAPIIEPLDIYLSKTSEEIVNEQTYAFTDRGDRKVVLRPEMTPSVSRLVAAKRQSLSYPLRLFSIPNLWRYERPQRGRLREHWQLNVDIFGVNSISAEFELLLIVRDIFNSFKADLNMYEIRLNHRELTNYLLKDYLDLNDETAKALFKLIDRMPKMDKTVFISSVDEILSDEDKQKGKNENLLKILETKDINVLPEQVKNSTGFRELSELIDRLNKQSLTNVKYDPSIMRGFDYYTGLVFEVFDTDKSNSRALMGGGRYDGLIENFGVEGVATVGFGWGDVALTNFLETHHLLPDYKPVTKVQVIVIGEIGDEVLEPVNYLRQNNINVAIDYSKKKTATQLKVALKENIPYVLFIGEDEVKSKVYKLKNLALNQEYSKDIKEILNIIKENK